MAPRTTLTAAKLAALGSDRLAGILVGLAESDPGIRRRLRLELAAADGGGAVAAQVRTRLATIKAARSFVDWQKRREFVKDLELQRAMIAERVAQADPDLALELMWRFLDLAEPVLERVDDSSGSVGDVFRSACNDLGRIAARARLDRATLADQAFEAMVANGYGVCDGLVEAVLPALGEDGAARLEARLTDALTKRPGSTGAWDWRSAMLRGALQTIADHRADVDAFIALVPPQDRANPHFAAAIGRRLLAAGRTGEALAALEAADRADRRADEGDWEEVYFAALEADGQGERAQALSWAAFEERLSAVRLRAFLKGLPDFDGFAAERRAREHAVGYGDFATALQFFHDWPDPDGAAHLVLARHAEIDGNAYYLLDPAAARIEPRHPLAATILRRAMIEDTLAGAKSTRYKHAARHLRACRVLAEAIHDYGSFETHESFTSRLRAAYGRKSGFWAEDGRHGDRGFHGE